MDAMERLVRDAVKREHDLIESYCERMLVTPGAWGVLVERWPDRFEVSLSAEHEPMAITEIRHDAVV